MSDDVELHAPHAAAQAAITTRLTGPTVSARPGVGSPQVDVAPVSGRFTFYLGQHGGWALGEATLWGPEPGAGGTEVWGLRFGDVAVAPNLLADLPTAYHAAAVRAAAELLPALVTP